MTEALAARVRQQRAQMTHSGPSYGQMSGGNDLAFRGSVLPVGRTNDGRTVAAWPQAVVAPVNALQSLFSADSGDVREFMDGGADRYIGDAAELGMAAGVGSAGAPAPDNALRMFGGRGAKTADMGALARAEAMAAEGADRRAIWDATGWFQGADGKWRFEIDDSGARLNLKAAHDFGVYGDSRAEYLLPHRHFSDAYGRDHWVSRQAGVGASYDNGRIGIGPDIVAEETSKGHVPLRPEALRSSLLHEMQHGIQESEGFARGGSPGGSGVPFVYQGKAAEVGAEIDHLEQQIGAAMDADPNAWNSPAVREMRTRLYDLREQVDGYAAFEGYRRLAGEVEARNVQARRDMTPAERRATPPWETQDVPDEQQIVRFGAGVQESRPGPFRENLPMDEASRMARAREMGFDVERPLYRGQVGEYPEMRRSPGMFGDGVYTSPDPDVANAYAGEAGANVLPLTARGKIASFDEYQAAIRENGWDGVQEALRARGFTGAYDDKFEDAVVVFDPKNLRSRFARFDPARSDEADLLAANASALPGAAAAAQRDAMPSGVERFPAQVDHEGEFLRWAAENGLMRPQQPRAFPAMPDGYGGI